MPVGRCRSNSQPNTRTEARRAGGIQEDSFSQAPPSSLASSCSYAGTEEAYNPLKLPTKTRQTNSSSKLGRSQVRPFTQIQFKLAYKPSQAPASFVRLPVCLAFRPAPVSWRSWIRRISGHSYDNIRFKTKKHNRYKKAITSHMTTTSACASPIGARAGSTT